MTDERKTNPMEEEAIRLIRKQNEEFSKQVVRGDLSEILLKGHLLIEYYIDHSMLLIFDKNAKVHKKSFWNKITELKNSNCFWDHDVAIGCLFSLNKVRNDLAHQLNFEVTISQIDSIGYHLGKEYILKRYSKEDSSEKDLLLWTLQHIVAMVYYPIWKAAIEAEKKKL